jgi:hypothetical protein
MKRSGIAPSFVIATILLTTSHASQAAAAHNRPVQTQRAACDLTKRAVAAERHLQTSVIAFCDIIPPDAGPKGYYVVGLHSKRDDCGDDVCGSTLIGWFVVEGSTGRVFETDVEDWRPGRLIQPSPDAR